MPGDLIAPVIPSSNRPAARGRTESGSTRRPPLAVPPADRPAPYQARYGIGRIDASGRVSDRAVICALGWRRGDRLTLTADAGVVVARRDDGGISALPPREYLVIPAVLRRRCGLRAGDLVLLAAVPGEDALAADYLQNTYAACRLLAIPSRHADAFGCTLIAAFELLTCRFRSR